jgi:FkbM family methyltransferase
MRISEILKRKILGTTTGIFFTSARDFFNILHTAWNRSEILGTVANDQLAVFLVSRICRSNRTFVDVGAHIGSIIATVLQNDPSIKIVGIEGIPEKVIHLRRKFPLAVFHQCAAGDQEGQASFFVNTRATGYSSLSSQWNADKDGTREIQVKVQKLDKLIESQDVDTIKIDVEGAELGVLRGAQDILSKSRPIVMFESGPGECLGYTKAALWQLLTEHQFAIIVPNRVAHDDNGLSLEGFIESHLYPRRTTNYFAIPLERRTEVRDRARKLLGIAAATSAVAE